MTDRTQTTCPSCASNQLSIKELVEALAELVFATNLLPNTSEKHLKDQLHAARAVLAKHTGET
jgi:hypothetical protein